MTIFSNLQVYITENQQCLSIVMLAAYFRVLSQKSGSAIVINWTSALTSCKFR